MLSMRATPLLAHCGHASARRASAAPIYCHKRSFSAPWIALRPSGQAGSGLASPPHASPRFKAQLPEVLEEDPQAKDHIRRLLRDVIADIKAAEAEAEVGKSLVVKDDLVKDNVDLGKDKGQDLPPGAELVSESHSRVKGEKKEEKRKDKERGLDGKKKEKEEKLKGVCDVKAAVSAEDEESSDSGSSDEEEGDESSDEEGQGEDRVQRTQVLDVGTEKVKGIVKETDNKDDSDSSSDDSSGSEEEEEEDVPKGDGGIEKKKVKGK